MQDLPDFSLYLGSREQKEKRGGSEVKGMIQDSFVCLLAGYNMMWPRLCVCYARIIAFLWIVYIYIFFDLLTQFTVTV